MGKNERKILVHTGEKSLTTNNTREKKKSRKRKTNNKQNSCTFSVRINIF